MHSHPTSSSQKAHTYLKHTHARTRAHTHTHTHMHARTHIYADTLYKSFNNTANYDGQCNQIKSIKLNQIKSKNIVIRYEIYEV
jgi:hypothetical protein